MDARAAPKFFAAAPAATLTRMLLAIGDSLAVGMRPSLEARAYVPIYQARVGMRTDQGLRLLLRHHQRAPIVLLSLGTNDLGRSERWMARRVRRVLHWLGPHGCAVWATVRVTWTRRDDPLNAALRRAHDRRLVLVSAPQPAADGVHLTPLGYEQRATRYLRAARRCP